MMASETVESAAAQLEAATGEEVLAWGIETFGPRLAVATSFQAEGMVILDMAARLSSQVRVFTLDTGRLPRETYDFMAQARRRYGIRLEVVFPDTAEVESMVGRYGPNLFYEAAPYRMLCCQIRKTRPLDRKLATLDAWVTGLRRGQSENRSAVRAVEIDRSHGGIVKLNPLAGWSAGDVEDYTQRHEVPRHPLYAQGYTSMGCAPCTRATVPGEDPRAGRWWWESDAAKECGIHFSPQGGGQRQLDVLIEEVLGGR